MYSQNKEEQIITEYFAAKNKVGKFIDIGAFHVFQLSNTRKLYEEGWRGVLVEADPINYKAIAEHYENEPRIEVLNVAIGVSNEELEFYSSGGDAVSTSVQEHKEKWQKGGVNFETIKIPQLHVAEFLEANGKDASFISIDTEATNIQIFNAIPDWFWQQIDMICIEHDNCIVEIVGKLAPFGLETKHLNAENIILYK